LVVDDLVAMSEHQDALKTIKIVDDLALIVAQHRHPALHLQRDSLQHWGDQRRAARPEKADRINFKCENIFERNFKDLPW
jgi:hypothetical protein